MAKSSKAQEIAELQAMLDAMPDDSDDEAIDEYEKENKEDPEEILEIRYRRKVKRKNWVGARMTLVCEGCGVTYYEALPGRYDGRLCGENCATIELENARELLDKARDYAPVSWIRELEDNNTLSKLVAPHLEAGTTPDLEPRPIPGAIERPATEAPKKPQTIAEKIAARLK